MKSLKGSVTAENLLKAYTGESQAVVQYAIFASIADKEGFKQIKNIFQETADNEAQHAKRYYRLLLAGFENELPAAIETPVGYGIFQGTTLENIQFSLSGEEDEATSLYPEFARIAQEEGYADAANAFRLIATVEKHHGQRFAQLAENIQNDRVFKKEEPVAWKCQKCGYIYVGEEAPKMCPACLHPQSYFEVDPDIY